jgi:hypothetical protein
LISSYNIIYDVYKEQDVFILKIKNIQRQGLYSPSGQIPELKKLLETAIKNNDENKIRAINEQIERLEHVVSLMNTHNQKPVLDTPIYAEIIRLDKSTCIVEIIKFDEFGIIIYTGERYIRTKIK